ncbi:hypothetical protein SLS54_005028 [Diplodia seriata]
MPKSKRHFPSTSGASSPRINEERIPQDALPRFTAQAVGQMARNYERTRTMIGNPAKEALEEVTRDADTAADIISELIAEGADDQTALRQALNMIKRIGKTSHKASKAVQTGYVTVTQDFQQTIKNMGAASRVYANGITKPSLRDGDIWLQFEAGEVEIPLDFDVNDQSERYAAWDKWREEILLLQLQAIREA